MSLSPISGILALNDDCSGRCREVPTRRLFLSSSQRRDGSAEYHPFYIQNLKLLRDFLIKPFRVEETQEAQVLESLQAYLGVSVRSLLDAHPGLAVDVIWALFIKQYIFIDLSAVVFTSWDQVFLYRSAGEVPKTSPDS